MRPFAFACLALLVLPLTARCQNGTGILTEPGLVMRAAPPRQLTLNAGVTQFAYQPGGDGIAYVSFHDVGGSRTVAIKFVGTHEKDPDTRTLYTLTGSPPNSATPTAQIPVLELRGWSGDGRYLVIEQEDADQGQIQYLCGDIGVSNFQARPIPPPPSPTDSGASPLPVWSPAHTRLLLVTDDYRHTATDVTEICSAEIYDPIHDRVQPQKMADGFSVVGWLDEDHLLLERSGRGQGEKTAYFSHDIKTDAEIEIAKPTPAPRTRMSWLFPSASPPTTPKAPGLTLEVQPQTIKDTQGAAQTKAQAIWLRKAKAPKAVSALAIGVTPGEDDPQAQWSPEGDGVGFVGHGDLFVAALTVQDATPREKVAAGEKLGCDEEKQIIMDNLKQLGLGIIQYVQDNDEKLPAGGGWHDAVYPYIKDESVFDFAGVRPVYRAPTNLSLAAMDAPAETVIATADTPCAHIVLYGDGHVKAFAKAEADLPSPP